MRLATYNVENLFTRARVLNLDTWSEGRGLLEAYAEVNSLLEEAAYTDAIKERILGLLKKLGLDKKNDSKFALLRENRGHLIKRSLTAKSQIFAEGRAGWVGWVELKNEIINETATRNTAQVVRDIGADVMGVVECEGRPALMQFSYSLLPGVKGAPYDQVMLVDGNDDRGIDVGLMAKSGYRIGWMRSHVDDVTSHGNRVFSRDCPEFSVWTPSGETVWVLVNHFKSKGYGAQDASDARRWLQAEAVRRIYDRLKAEGAKHIAVMGDLNDTPDSQALAPLLRETDLKDAAEHPNFDDGGRPGTYGNCTAREKIDYLLLSPALFERMEGGGIWRRGVWGGKNGNLWDVYPEMQSSYHAASDHAALWAELRV
ncbi:MAG: endonuclease/exonuclease/phosphatase family protein [Hyphomicrobiaceae bacterium]